MTKRLDIDEMERVGNAATAAPWESVSQIENSLRSFVVRRIKVDNGLPTVFDSNCTALTGDADFVSFARNNWPAICVELRRLRDENEMLKTDAERWRCTRKYGAQEVGLVWHTEDGVPITMHDVRADFAVDAMIRMLNKQGTTTCRLTR